MTTPLPEPATAGQAARPFAGTAQAYAMFRIAYPPPLLADLTNAAGGGGRLLDLACGTGELALPLAANFRQVLAVDAEPDMIAAGRDRAASQKIANIDWQVQTAESVTVAPGSLNLVTIGNAFHRLDRTAVATSALQWLTPGGLIAIVNTDSVWKGTAPWQHAAVEVISRWVPAPPPTPSARRRSHEQILDEAGFDAIAERRYPTPHTWSIDTFLGYLHSTSVVSKTVLAGNAAAFESEMRHTLEVIEPGGRLTETARFSCLTARRPH